MAFYILSHLVVWAQLKTQMLMQKIQLCC